MTDYRPLNKTWSLVFITLICLAAVRALGQDCHPDKPTVGKPWQGASGITETVGEIMARDALDPFRWDGYIRLNSEHDANLQKMQGPPVPNVSSWPPNRGGGGGYLENPQVIGTSFLGIVLGEAGFIPADSVGDVGPTQIVVCANGRIKVFSKAGVVGGLNTSTNTFFNSVRNASGTSDPMVRYDRLTGRWFVIAINVSTPNRILIAVSGSATITNETSFTFFQFQQDSVSPGADLGKFADYPSLGVDANALYIGANMFLGNTFERTSAWVIRKSALLTGSLVVTAFRGMATGTVDGPYSPRGVDQDDPAATQGYFIGVGTTSWGTLWVRRITSPGGTPTISANIAVAGVVATGPPAPIDPPNSGGLALDSLDDRLFQARMRKNKLTGLTTLWTAHNIQVTNTGVAGAGNRNGSRWYEIQNMTGAPSVRQLGTLFDSAASNPFSYWIPSVMMSGQGHMALACSRSSANTFAGIATAGRLGTDTLGTIQAPTLVIAGVGSYSVNPPRWGDYSMTSVDPNDDMTMWSFQEYANTTNSWGVRVFQLKAPPPAAIATLTPNTLQQGQTSNVALVGTSSAGSGYFDPDAAFANHIAAAFSGSGVTVNSITFTDPTHITLNVTVDGGATAGLRDLTITNPDSQFVTGTGVFTVTSGSNPVPTTTSINPTSATLGSSGFPMTVTGTNFIASSVVRFNGSDRATTFDSPTQLTATILASDLTATGTFNVAVFNGAPGGGTSNAQTFTVNNPVPTTTSIVPNSKSVGDAGFPMTVNGTGFVSGSTVRLNGSDRFTAFVSSTELTATIPASDMAVAGTFNITVFNGGPGGGTSNAQTFTVNAVPVVVGPTSLTVVYGQVLSGGLAELLASDNNRLEMTRPPTLITLEGTSPILAPSQMAINFEGHAGTSNVQMTTFAYNFITATYDLIDNRVLGLSDAAFSVNVPNPLQHMDGTGLMRIRFLTKNQLPGNSNNWRFRVDRVSWTITP